MPPPGSSPGAPPGPARNRIFAALPASTQERLTPLLRSEELRHHSHLYRAGRLIERVYLPDYGVVSLVQRMRDGRTVEVGTIGNDGIAGVQALFGLDRAQLDTLVQMPGHAHWAAATDFEAVARGCPQLQQMIRGAMHLQILQIAQTAACNRLHGLEQRCCRWLLTAHDNAPGDIFPLTHDFLAMMLGVQRPGVTLAAGALQQAGLIRYARGWVEVLDRERLEGGACECYATVRRESEELLGDGAPADL